MSRSPPCSRTGNSPFRPQPCEVLVVLLVTGCPQGSFNPSTDDYQPSSGDTNLVSASSSGPTTSGPPFCGDYVVDGAEVCDDGLGNTQSPWEQVQTCAEGCMGYADYCGDGLTNGPEICDDGVANSDVYTGQPHCNADCTAAGPYCGDGACQAQENFMQCPDDCTNCGDGIIQEPDEECDEEGATVTCDGDCTFPSCGDGYLNMAAGEECDDGNKDETDGCRGDCKNAICGDGVVQAGVEDCDDGNQKDDDACSDACIAARRVFVSAGQYPAAAIQGVAGADMLCNEAAGAVPGLGGPGNTWLAWISDDNSSPSNRVPAANKSFTGWYLIPDPAGTPVTKGWSGLTSGTLVNPINFTEFGKTPEEPGFTWTNTKPDGTSAGASDCTNWTESDIMQSGNGDVTQSSSAWTESGSTTCGIPLHVYCLEVSH